MFYLVFLAISLWLSHALLRSHCEKVVNQKSLSIGIFPLLVVLILPFINISAFFIKELTIGNDLKVVFISLGSLFYLLFLARTLICFFREKEKSI